MKRNVVLFSILAVGALYMFYGDEKKSTSLEKEQIESANGSKTYRTRKLLSFANSNSNLQKVDSTWTSVGSLLEDTKNAQLELLGKETSHNFGVRNNKFTRRRKRRVPNREQNFAWKFNLNVTRYENNGTSKDLVKYPTASDEKPSKSDDGYLEKPSEADEGYLEKPGKSDEYLEKPSETDDGYLEKPSKSDEYLGMAMSVSGNGPNQSVEDLYQAWDSVGQFLRALFGGNLEELRDKGHGVSVDVSPLPNGTINLPHELFLEGSGDEESQELRNREGKFILGIFGFGGNKENPPRDEGSGDLVDIQEFNGTESNIQFDDTEGIKEVSTILGTSDNSESSSVSTIIPTENKNLKESVVSSTIFDQTSATSDPVIALKVTSINSVEDIISSVNCTDCELQTEMFASTESRSTEENPISHTLVSNSLTTNFPLSDEALKDFCITLFSRMRTSGRSIKESENSDGSGSFAIDENNVSDVSNVNTHAPKVLTDKPRLQNLGFFESIWNRIMGRRAAQVQDESSVENRGARLINFENLFEGFDSGRSANLSENSNMQFDVDVTGNIEDSEQFLSDCEEFLRSVQTETRPNIFDLVNPHTMESFTTEFTTQLGEDEKADNLITEIPFNFESITRNEVFTVTSSISKSNNIAEDQTTSTLPSSLITTRMQVEEFSDNADKKHFTQATQLEDLVFTEVQEKVRNDSLSVQNLVVENFSVSQEFPATETSNIAILVNVTEIELSIDESNGTKLSEGRSLNIFGFGSESDEGSSDMSNTKEPFLDGSINFSSGDREIKEIDITSTHGSVKKTESSKERSFKLNIDFGSGESEIKEMVISTEPSTDKSTISLNERSLSFNVDSGSGARELDNFNSSKIGNNEDLLTSTVTNEEHFSELNMAFGSGERELNETVELTTAKNEPELLFFASTEEFNIETRIPLQTSSFSAEITEYNIPSNTYVPLGEYDESEIYTEANEIPDERSLGFTLFGSGDGRELSNVLTDAEDTNCVGCFSEQNTTECDGCERRLNDTDIFPIFDTTTVTNSSVGEIPSENKICTDCEVTNLPMVKEDGSVTDSISDVMLSSTEVLFNEGRLETTNDMGLRPFNEESEDTSTDGITEIILELTTFANKSRTFPIFLDGSGVGGLFVDNKGPINLVEESEFTSPPVFPQSIQPRRGARKHDSLEFRQSTERIFKATETTPFRSSTESKIVTSPTPTDESTLNTFVTEAIDDSETDSVSFGINDEIVASVASTPTVQPEFAEVTVTSIPADTTTENVWESVTTIGVMVSTLPNIKPRSKVTEPPQRFCTSASQCNRDLNERCMFDGPTATCSCGRSYVRSPETGKCESPVVLKTSLKLPGEAFHQDLKNRNSERFRKMANDSIATMWILLGDDPELFRIVSGVDVSSFEEGSLVVHWEITLAAPENESVAELIEQLDAELKEAFEDEALLRKVPLNVHNAVLMAVTNDIDPCEKTELNYCSKNADCIRDPTRGFKCRCRDVYLDESLDMNHPGEVCIATCSPYYCGDHGECNLKQNGDLHCSCSSWYFGEKCEISGIVVIAGFASFNILLIIIVLFSVCFCRKRRYRQSKFYGQNQVRFQPEAELGRFTASPRLADTIAMSDVGPMKASKYMAISTPMHNPPTIRLTSPSILGSSVDYDYDSTFDRTPSVEEINVEVHKSGTTPKV